MGIRDTSLFLYVFFVNHKNREVSLLFPLSQLMRETCMDGKSVMSGDLQQPCTEAAGDPNEFLDLAAMRMPFGN